MYTATFDNLIVLFLNQVHPLLSQRNGMPCCLLWVKITFKMQLIKRDSHKLQMHTNAVIK